MISTAPIYLAVDKAPECFSCVLEVFCLLATRAWRFDHYPKDVYTNRDYLYINFVTDLDSCRIFYFLNVHAYTRRIFLYI